MASYDRKSYSGIAALTTLDGSINDSIETFSLADETGWPDGSAGDFYAQIEDEVVLCDVRTATTVTVKTGGRGACGTSAVAHASGVEVGHVFTSADADEANYTVSETVGKITAAGQILIGDGANSLAALDVKTSGRIIVGNGTTGASVALSGDATLASSGALTISGEAVTTGKILDDAVTYAKIQNVSATDRLLGRDTAAAGNVEELTVGGGIEFTGSAGIQRSALTGDVTATAGSNTTAIADNAVTAAKIATSVAGDGLAGGGGTALGVNADGATIQVSADAVGFVDAMGRGSLGYAQVTSAQTGITTEADLTSATVTVTGRSGSLLLILACCTFTSTVAADTIQLAIKEASTQLARGLCNVTTSAVGHYVTAMAFVAPTAATHTYKLALARVQGTGTVATAPSATDPVSIIVIDIGAA